MKVVTVRADGQNLGFPDAKWAEDSREAREYPRLNILHAGTNELIATFLPGRWQYVYWQEIPEDKESPDDTKRRTERDWHDRAFAASGGP